MLLILNNSLFVIYLKTTKMLILGVCFLLYYLKLSGTSDLVQVFENKYENKNKMLKSVTLNEKSHHYTIKFLSFPNFKEA